MIGFSSLLLLSVLTSAAPAKFQLIIDPGHGGHDRGAVAGSVRESEITLSVASELRRLLTQDPTFQVTLTRETDRFVSLQERSNIARQTKGDLLLSIHVNSNQDSRAHGVEVYFQNQLPPDEESMLMAARENGSTDREVAGHLIPIAASTHRTGFSPDVAGILEDLSANVRVYRSSEFAKLVRQKWKGNAKSDALSLRQAPFHVVANVELPSVLVEIGYISNAKEGAQLSSSAYQKTVAESLRAALLTYKESVDKPRSISLDSSPCEMTEEAQKNCVRSLSRQK